MLSTEYLLTHYVVYSCNESGNLCLTTDVAGALDILRGALTMSDEICIEDIENIEDDE
mgnify:CR=1 FL=1